MCVGKWEGAVVVEGVFTGTVPVKDAKQQMEYHCFLLPENELMKSISVFMYCIMISAEVVHYSSFK